MELRRDISRTKCQSFSVGGSGRPFFGSLVVRGALLFPCQDDLSFSKKPQALLSFLIGESRRLLSILFCPSVCVCVCVCARARVCLCFLLWVLWSCLLSSFFWLGGFFAFSQNSRTTKRRRPQTAPMTLSLATTGQCQLRSLSRALNPKP